MASSSTLHAVANGYDIDNQGKAQILFNQLEDKINKQPVWNAIHVPMSIRGQQQTERDLLAAFVKAFPNRRFAIGRDEKQSYSETYIYDVALWNVVRDYRVGVPRNYGQVNQLIRTAA